jgi:hypothetical protein
MGQARYYRLSYGDLSWVEMGYDSAGMERSDRFR